MSEEKKLTDGKSMFNYVANDILGQVKPLYLRKRIVTEIFDLIHRLQDEKACLANKVSLYQKMLDEEFEPLKETIERQKVEIERLTAQIDQRREMMHRMDCNYATELQKNAELQKQVDELTKLVDKWENAYGDDYWLAKHKEMLKEMLQEVDKESRGQTVSVTNVLRKRYGVEVE